MLFWLMIILVALFFVLAISPVFLRVPFLPVHKKQAKKMMELAKIKPGMKVVDLGSGAGRLLFLAAGNGATAIGYELNPFLFWWTKLIIILKNRRGQVEVKLQSIYEADISAADVVFTFLSPNHMKKLETKLLSEMKPGALVVSYAFSLKGHIPIKNEEGIFIYKT